MHESMRLKDQPASQRPRERLVERGPDALTHAELIAILLRTGLKGANVVQVGQNLLSTFGNSLNALALASVDEVRKIPGIGRDKAATLVAAFALAKRMEQERREESPVLDNPVTVVNSIPGWLGGWYTSTPKSDTLGAPCGIFRSDATRE